MDKRAVGTASAIGIAIAVIIIAGIGYQVYQYNEIKNGLKVKGTDLRNFSTEGVGPIPTRIKLDLNINVRNASRYSLDIKRLSYGIEVEGRDFGQGSIRDVALPANTTKSLPITVDASSTDVIRTVWDYITEGCELEISGIVEVPFKLYGAVEMFDISTTYHEVKYIKRRGITPTRKEASDLTLKKPPSTVLKGETVTFTGRLTDAETGAGLPHKKIMIYDDDYEQDDFMASGWTDSDGNYTITWNAEVIDPPLGREADIYAKFPGTTQYGESDSCSYAKEVYGISDGTYDVLVKIR